MRMFRFAVWVSGAAMGVGVDVCAQDTKPLPDPTTLRARALATNASTEALREKYLCRVRAEVQQVDGKGGVKNTEVDERESFFVKGRQINQIVTKNGKPLEGGDAKKQIDRVKKQIEEAEAGKANPNAIGPQQILRLIKLTNERRVTVAGRPTILFDGVGDPSAKTNSIAEKAVEAMEGTLAIDEQTGQLQDVNVRGVRDVKIAGGLVANIHKGFLLHVIAVPRASDGVWMLQEMWGSGDARVGLFMHPSYRMHQVSEGCRLFDVQSDSVETLQEKH